MQNLHYTVAAVAVARSVAPIEFDQNITYDQ